MIVWIIVGLVIAHGGVAAPTTAEFMSESSCMAAKQATEAVARDSNLRCIEVEVARK